MLIVYRSLLRHREIIFYGRAETMYKTGLNERLTSQSNVRRPGRRQSRVSCAVVVGPSLQMVESASSLTRVTVPGGEAPPVSSQWFEGGALGHVALSEARAVHGVRTVALILHVMCRCTSRRQPFIQRRRRQCPSPPRSQRQCTRPCGQLPS